MLISHASVVFIQYPATKGIEETRVRICQLLGEDWPVSLGLLDSGLIGLQYGEGEFYDSHSNRLDASCVMQ
jgi:hypothetical protein